MQVAPIYRNPYTPLDERRALYTRGSEGASRVRQDYAQCPALRAYLMSLVQINQTEPPEKIPLEEAWKQVRPIFEMTAGQLRKELEKQGSVPDDLLDEIQIAVNTRNKLAHYYLLEFRMRSFSADGVPPEAMEEMVMVRALFQDLNARLEALTHQRAKERGWDRNEPGVY